MPSAGGGGTAASAAAIDDNAFYTISTTVDGEELAVTFVPPEGPDIKTINNYASKSRVELRKLTREPSQQWQPHDEHPQYLLFAKLKDEGSEHGGALQIYNFDKRLDDDDKHNRLTVGNYDNESSQYWHLEPVAGGKYRIKSQLGMSEHPGVDDWDAPRALAAVKGASGIKMQSVPVRDDPAQYWTLTKAR